MEAEQNALTMREVRQEQAHFTWLRLTISVCVCAGYASAIFTARHLTVAGVFLLTATTLAWLSLYLLLFREHMAPRLWGASALAVFAYITVLTSWLAMGFDWLMPVITTGVIVMTYSLAFSAITSFALWLASSLAMFVVTGHLDATQFNLLTAFLFVLVFAFMLRRFLLARTHMQHLVATLAQSKAELEATHMQLQEYAVQVEELAVTYERNRIAREIHDTLGHYLTLLAVQLETATILEGRGDPGLHNELLEARRVAKECLAQVRRSVAALRPVEVTMGTFDVVLRRLVSEFALVSTKVEISLDLEEAMHELSPLLRDTLYRCTQEALTNIRKHAHATKVLLRLRTEEHLVELTVLDNGQGVESHTDTHPPGFGLLGMRERVALLGGRAQAGAEPGRGWRVEVVLPRGKQEKQGQSILSPLITSRGY